MRVLPQPTMRAILASCLACALIGTACDYVATPSPTSPTTDTTASTTTSSGTATTSSLTYVTDIQPILTSDCVRCHGPSRADAGVNLSTYAGVMKTVQPGSAGSLLVLVTQSGGIMYGEFSGNRSTKAATIKTWVVNANAAQQ